MSVSRKRFRPLDPEEERQIKPDQKIGIEILEDEQSYYFSWPNALLTALFASSSAYVQQHIYHPNSNNTYGKGSKANSNGTMVSSNSERIWSSSISGLVRPAPTALPIAPFIFVPPVYDLSSDSILDSGARGAMSDGFGQFLEDMEPLLGPVMRAEKYSNSVAIPMTAGCSNEHLNPIRSPSTKRFREDQGAPSSFPSKYATYADSIFSLNGEQLKDVEAAGLLSFPMESVENIKQKHNHAYHKHVVIVSEDKPWPDLEMPQAIHTMNRFRRLDASAPCLQRQCVESEIVALEWRAFYESQRAAGALRRLLSLEAAVPFIPTAKEARQLPPDVSGAHYNRSKHCIPCPNDFDIWREKVYHLWLYWRLNSVPKDSVLTACTHCSKCQSGSFESELLNTNFTSQETNSIAKCYHSRYPWGPSLLVSAFLHDIQYDYFIDPQQGGLVTTTPGFPTFSLSSTAVTTPCVLPRRRGSYNFLRWRIELYMARLAQNSGTAAASLSSSYSEQQGATTLSSMDQGSKPIDLNTRYANTTQLDGTLVLDKNSRGAKIGSLSSTHSSVLLGASEVNDLLQKEVLARPLIELEQDTEQSRLDLLESSDLKQDVEMWRFWLSKV